MRFTLGAAVIASLSLALASNPALASHISVDFGPIPSDGDDFGEAVSDFLYGHAWHQGTIYPITPKVLPFVLDALEAMKKPTVSTRSASVPAPADVNCCIATQREPKP